jgi:uncharacterized protein (TIGR03435 family)
MRRALTLAVCVCAAAAVGWAQAPAFEVASIRPNTTGGFGKDGAPTPLGAGSVTTPQGTRWRASNVTVRTLIRFAYGPVDDDLSTPLSLQEYQVAEGPEWTTREAFDVEARMPEGPRAPGDSLLMLRTLLAERFALKVHTEAREMPVYALVRTERPAALRAASGTCEPRCGARAGFDGFMASGVSMASLSVALTPIAGRPVVDRTGLTGSFDFQLRYAADPNRESKFPSIFTAVQEQLGLKLDSTRAPIDVLVMDHVERPTEK